MEDNNADGTECLFDMKTAKLSVICHLDDHDQKRFSLMQVYWRYIAGTTSDLRA